MGLLPSLCTIEMMLTKKRQSMPFSETTSININGSQGPGRDNRKEIDGRTEKLKSERDRAGSMKYVGEKRTWDQDMRDIFRPSDLEAGKAMASEGLTK
jgi:hypothetical protein